MKKEIKEVQRNRVSGSEKRGRVSECERKRERGWWERGEAERNQETKKNTVTEDEGNF